LLLILDAPAIVHGILLIVGSILVPSLRDACVATPKVHAALRRHPEVEN
jgi:hypothetical protein